MTHNANEYGFVKSDNDMEANEPKTADAHGFVANDLAAMRLFTTTKEALESVPMFEDDSPAATSRKNIKRCRSHTFRRAARDTSKALVEEDDGDLEQEIETPYEVLKCALNKKEFEELKKTTSMLIPFRQSPSGPHLTAGSTDIESLKFPRLSGVLQRMLITFTDWIQVHPLIATQTTRKSPIPALFTNPPVNRIVELNMKSCALRTRTRQTRDALAGADPAAVADWLSRKR